VATSSLWIAITVKPFLAKQRTIDRCSILLLVLSGRISCQISQKRKCARLQFRLRNFWFHLLGRLWCQLQKGDEHVARFHPQVEMLISGWDTLYIRFAKRRKICRREVAPGWRIHCARLWHLGKSFRLSPVCPTVRPLFSIVQGEWQQSIQHRSIFVSPSHLLMLSTNGTSSRAESISS
jgi:hypothetical protein